MVVRNNSKFGPAIYNGQQAEMIIRWLFFSRTFLRQREPIEHFITQEQILACSIRLEDRSTSGLNAFFQLVSLALDHQLVELRHRLRILPNLFLRRRVENGQTGVDMPLVRIDPQCDVDLDIFDTTYPPSNLPRELIV